jgi:oxygen-dependent protoporphyrinogen oxidase
VSGKRAIVVGGGPAGASAAFRLKQAGVKVRLIERDARVGGRTRSERMHGFVVDVAAGLLPGTYQAFYRLMNDAGLKDVLEPMTSPTAVVRDGQFHYLQLNSMAKSMLTTSLLGLRSKLGFARIGAKALSMWTSLGFDDLSKAAPYDNESLEQYARRALTGELYEYLLNPTQKTMYTLSGADASVVDFFWCARNLMSPSAYCVKGGMDRIVTQVAEQLDVSVSTTVGSIEQRGERVEVHMRDVNGRESTDIVDFCVIATASREVPEIDRGLSAASAEYLRSLRYSMLTDLHLRLRERPAEKAVMVMVPDVVDPDLCGILLDHNKGSDRAPAGKGSLSVYFVDAWAQKAYGWPDEQIYEVGMRKLERVMPGITALVEGYHVQRWDHAATLSYPSYYKKLSDFRRGLDFGRRVQLAGDYFSMASVNTAVTSGEIAAQRLVQNYL